MVFRGTQENREGVKVEKKITLSVIVPVYNVEPYLRRCLDSILDQTYVVDEIICVDDGSTDNSLSILKEYAAKYDRIKVLSKSNGGLVSTRKAGLKNALGKYISYVDSDDWIEKNMYEEMLKVMINDKADLVTSGCVRDYGSHLYYEDEGIHPGIYEGEKLYNELLGRLIEPDTFFKSNLSIHIYNKIFLKEKLLKKQLIVDDEISIGEDAACVYPYILDSEKIVVMGKSYYHYCIRGDSIMGSPGKDEYRKGLLLKKLLLSEFGKHKNIPNVNKQCQNIIAYLSMLQCAAEVIKYKDNILIPYGKLDKDERIVIYGRGKFGIQLKKILSKMNFNVVAWIDKKSIVETEQINYLEKIDFDKILVAVLGADMVLSINADLVKKKIEQKKIINIEPALLFDNESIC